MRGRCATSSDGRHRERLDHPLGIGEDVGPGVTHGVGRQASWLSPRLIEPRVGWKRTPSSLAAAISSSSLAPPGTGKGDRRPSSRRTAATCQPQLGAHMHRFGVHLAPHHVEVFNQSNSDSPLEVPMLRVSVCKGGGGNSPGPASPRCRSHQWFARAVRQRRGSTASELHRGADLCHHAVAYQHSPIGDLAPVLVHA